jgi:hypothetical protein
VRGCPKQKEIRKQDQSGILAQIFLLCGKLRLEFSANDYSEPECGALSSAAMVTAAGAVQDSGNLRKGLHGKLRLPVGVSARAWERVRSKLKCPVFVAHDMSGLTT